VSWRREVEDLVGAPTASPALIGWVVYGVARWRPAAPHDASEPPAATDATTVADASIAWMALWLVGDASSSATRTAVFADAVRMLAPGATLIVVDHNRPRQFPAAVAAVVRAPRPPGRSPAARWRRLARATAQEVRAAGLAVERLRLAAGERIQVVVARRLR
jgi:hypothetical protein